MAGCGPPAARLTEEEHMSLMAKSMEAYRVGDMKTYRELMQRIQDGLNEFGVVDEEEEEPNFLAEGEDETELDHNRRRKKLRGEKRTASEIDEAEKTKIKGQVRDFFDGADAESQTELLHHRRIAAVLMQAAKLEVMEQIQDAWNNNEVPILRIEHDATNVGMLLPTELLDSALQFLSPNRQRAPGGARHVLDASAKVLT